MTEIAKLQERIKNFCDERDWDQYHNAKALAIGLITEAGELLDIFRFKSAEEVDQMFKNPEKRTKISEELADSLYFILRLAERYNIDLVKEVNKKIMKNETKYPIAKAKGSNKKYTEF